MFHTLKQAYRIALRTTFLYIPLPLNMVADNCRNVQNMVVIFQVHTLSHAMFMPFVNKHCSYNGALSNYGLHSAYRYKYLCIATTSPTYFIMFFTGEFSSTQVTGCKPRSLGGGTCSNNECGCHYRPPSPVVGTWMLTIFYGVKYNVTMLHELCGACILTVIYCTLMMWQQCCGWEKKVGGGKKSSGSFLIYFLHFLSIPPFPFSLSNFPHLLWSLSLSPLSPPSYLLPLPFCPHPCFSPSHSLSSSLSSPSSPSSSHPSFPDHIGDTDRAWGQNSCGSWSKASILQGTYRTICTQEKSRAGARIPLKRGHYWAIRLQIRQPLFIVPVMKTSLRIFGDFKVTVKQVSKLDMHPIPKIYNLFVILTGGKRLLNFDMSQA